MRLNQCMVRMKQTSDSKKNSETLKFHFWWRGPLLTILDQLILGLLHDYFWIFSIHGEKYYFCMEGSMQGEIEPTQGEIEMSIETNIPAGGGVWGGLARLEQGPNWGKGSGGQTGGQDGSTG